jgi:hypothetical protein
MALAPSKDAGRVRISTECNGIPFLMGFNAAIAPRRVNAGAERTSLLSVVVLHAVGGASILLLLLCLERDA